VTGDGERPRFGRGLACFNRVVTNRLGRPFARYAPGFGVVIHTGRKSGREYATPVAVFRDGSNYVIALTYGPGAEWVRNVLAAGRCELITRGRRYEFGSPEVIHDESRRPVPSVVRRALRLLRAADFLRLSGAEDGQALV
jgi:deazaflavin-dependent oxidoreductase (nitroreductase family)